MTDPNLEEVAKSRRAFLLPLPLGEGISGQTPKGKALFDANPRLFAAASNLPVGIFVFHIASPTSHGAQNLNLPLRRRVSRKEANRGCAPKWLDNVERC